VDLPELALRPVDDGVRFELRVVPGARRDAVLGGHGRALRVAVRAVAEKGRANRAVEQLLAGALGLAPGKAVVVGGLHRRDKVIEIRGLSLADLEARLAALVAGAQAPG
jgi:uncharacterized protein